MHKHEFAFFHNIPTPHKVDLFNSLYEKLNGKIKFYFFGHKVKKRSDWDKFLQYAKFDYEFLPTKMVTIKNNWDPGYMFLPKELPDISRYKKIVIIGSAGPTELSLAFKAKKAGIPYILSSGAISLKGGSPVLIPVRFVLRKWYFSNAHTVIAANTLAKEHALRMGARRVEIAYTSFDLSRFDYDRKHEGNFLKILFVGRLVKVKRLPDILHALNKLDRQSFSFTIIGDGPEKNSIERLITKFCLSDNVKLADAIPYDRIHEIYRDDFNLLILSSEMEVHGFVIMEALMSSIPVITTEKVGAKDFVIPEAIYPVGNVEELRKRIEWMRNPENRNRAVEFGKRMIKEKATPERWAEVFRRVLEDSSP